MKAIMTFRKKIMVSRPNFELIIKNKYIYVDKTDYLRKIIGLISKEEREYFIEEINKSKQSSVSSSDNYDDLGDKDSYYFMHGPRRFGKSLTLSVLKYFYEGRSDLFRGLKIYEYMKENNISWEQVQRPVIYIDFSVITCSDNNYMKCIFRLKVDTYSGESSHPFRSKVAGYSGAK